MNPNTHPRTHAPKTGTGTDAITNAVLARLNEIFPASSPTFKDATSLRYKDVLRITTAAASGKVFILHRHPSQSRAMLCHPSLTLKDVLDSLNIS